MAGLDVLGGIGKGLMQGSEFIQKRQEHADNARIRDQYLANQKAQLDLQTEQHQWKADEQKRQAADRERLQGYQTLSMRIDTEYADRTPAERAAMKLKHGFETGLIPHDEFQKLQTATQQFEREGLMGDLLAGNVKGIAAKFSQKLGRPVSVDIQQGKAGNTYRLTDEDGSFLREVNDEQIGMIFGMKELMDLGEVGRKNEQHAAAVAKDRAAASASYANAGKYEEETKGQKLKNEGLAALAPAERGRASSGGGSNGPQSPIGREAHDLYAAGLAKSLGEATEMARADRSLGEAAGILKDDPQYIMMNQSQKAAAIRNLAKDLRSGDREGPAGALANDPLGIRIK